MTYLIFEKVAEHLFLALSALFIALFIALPLAFVFSRTRHKSLALATIRLAEIVQTIPGLAMLAVIVIFLSSITAPATGVLPAIIALTLYALAPILTNTYTGIRQISPALIEVARGMGMTSRQVLYIVEVPQALPMMMAGARIAGVWTIGMATLTSLVGAGGLGDLIMQGLRSMQPTLVLAGTIPAVLLALFFEWSMTRLEVWLTN